MAEFVRSLPEQLASELAKLAADENPNWWREILSNQDLHLAIREDYLNVYAKGQSVFKIELGKDKRPVMTTHYKYLLKPKMPPGKEYVTFDGRKFLMSGKPVDPSRLVQNSYVPNETIPELVRTATSYSNAEKSGVHIVANENSNVIDMEIAFSKVRDPEDPAKSDEADDDKRGRANSTALRIDLAALHPDGADKARLVFYEVKRFDDGRLWGSQPEVLNQIEQYDAFLESKEGKLKTAYKNVCKGLTERRQMKGTKPLSGLVGDVALERRKLVIEKACRLVVFGFDRDQQKGRLEQLKKALGLGDRMITRGSPKGLKLHPGDAP